MPPKGRPQVKWTHAVKQRFIDTYLELGSARAAARAMEVSLSNLYAQRRADPAFADDWNRATMAAHEQTIDRALDETINGRLIETRTADGTVVTHREPVSDRIQAMTTTMAAKTIGAYRAAREADPDADIAARRRVRIGLLELAKRMGILF